MALARRQGLSAGLSKLLLTLFGPRILPFDQDSAMIFGTLLSRARAAGCAMSFADGQIAAIAVRHGFSVATRDTAPFLAAGIAVVNPWTEARG